MTPSEMWYWNPTGGDNGLGVWKKWEGNISGSGDASPDTLAQPIPFLNVTGWEAYHFPAGSNITYLTVSVVGKGLLSTDIPINIAGLLYLDADSDAARDLICGATGDPVEGVPAPGLILCPVGIMTIPLRSALAGGDYLGGRIDVRSLDGKALTIIVTAG